MDAGVHLPQLDLLGAGLSLDRVLATATAARDAGFMSVSANDHLVFRRPWLDGLTALATVLPVSAPLELMTSVLVPALRGPMPVAAALASLDALSDCRLVAGLGAGSSPADYEAAGIPWEERWARLEEVVPQIRAALRGGVAGLRASPRAGGIPVWLASWGSQAGLRRVARLGDGWLASAYNIDPGRFAAATAYLRAERARLGGPAAAIPHALVTMWTWVTESESEATRVLGDVLAPFLGRDPARLRDQVCVGSAEHCARLLSRYARAGCARVHFWPLADEVQQIRLLAAEVLPRVEETSTPT